jgi:phage terminase large subunit-like protein
VASNRIVSIVEVGWQEVYDFEVEHWHSYLAADLIHHNTEAGAYEVTAHLTGLYPPWWEGKRFTAPTRWWAAGDTMETTRDVIQVALMGPHEGVGERRWAGMIPPWLVYHTTRRLGAIPNCLGEIHVRHHGPDGRENGVSTLGLKSYDQGRKSFQGPEKEGVWLDEEPPDAGEDQREDIWTECLLRLMTTEGILIGTFTPVRGMTTFIERYLETAVMPDPRQPGAVIDAKQGFQPDALVQTEAE